MKKLARDASNLSKVEVIDTYCQSKEDKHERKCKNSVYISYASSGLYY